MTRDRRDLLATVTAALAAAEDRPGQRAMADAVATALETKRHLVIQAGTGTGKTLGYLVPAIAAGKRVVVATATKALQDQLATKDLPFLTEHLPIDFSWAVLKGRANYVCLQRLRELLEDTGQGQLELDGLSTSVGNEVIKIAEWVPTSRTGDLGELTWTPSDQAQRAITVGGDECPGAQRCPVGTACYAEQARRKAEVADVVVVNLNLYGLDVAADGALLPEHDVVVFDEAHRLEDVMSDTIGVQIAPGRFASVATALRHVLAEPALPGGVLDAGTTLRDALRPHVGQRLPTPMPPDVQDAVVAGRNAVDRARTALRAIPKLDAGVHLETQQRVLRAEALATRLQEHLDHALGTHDGSVAFVSGSPDHPRLEIAPLDVAPLLRTKVWDTRTAVLTSATIPPGFAATVGLEAVDVLDVGSPFDYGEQGLLYCAAHLPDPRSPQRADAVHEELTALLTAAGGRTLALFTSWAAMDAAAAAVRTKVDVPIITQRDLPKVALLDAFTKDEATCLFATAGFFQGVDVPGRTLSLVVVDRLPFPRPDDPLLSARRERLGGAAFGAIDLPRAATLLAQAAGRLVRSRTDRGVVAVLDPRLATASYRWRIVEALPPMRRTRHRAEVEEFLGTILH